MLATLLPRSSAPIRRSLSSVIFSAVAAPREPRSACPRSFPREAAVSAVSEPEKNADSSSSARIAAAVSQKAASSEAREAEIEGPGVTGAASGAQAPQIGSSSAAVVFLGTGAGVQAPQTGSAPGTLVFLGTGAGVQAPQVGAASGQSVAGVASGSQAAQIGAAYGSTAETLFIHVPIVGTIYVETNV